MPDRRRIEDYGLIGSMRTGALVGRDGSIEWLPLPRFDSPACFAAMLGGPDNGLWRLAPREPVRASSRRYVEGTLVLETRFDTASGSVLLTDFMPRSRQDGEELVRIVRGLEGRVPMRSDLRLRFDYGHIRPWLQHRDGDLVGIAGPDAVRVSAPVELDPSPDAITGDFELRAGESLGFVMSWFGSSTTPPKHSDPATLLDETVTEWQAWSKRCIAPEAWREAVVRSAITLKALTHEPTGGIVAAATTSLPEQPGNVRNWDYRYCWLRDASFTLRALIQSGYAAEARAWRDWLRRSIAGDPDQLQIMYGLHGERRLDEHELPWLRGFADSQPVRIGNAAHRQRQIDIYGEVIDAFHTYRMHAREEDEEIWRVACTLLPTVEAHWQDACAGIWERRAHPRPYVTSRVMCWVAVDRAIQSAEHFGLDAPLERWRTLRQRIHDDVCRNGFSTRRGAFVDAIGSEELDASLLLVPLVGFLPPGDPRVVGTLDAVRQGLMQDGFVHRYDTGRSTDGLPSGEAPFVACTLWFADNLALMGHHDEAREVFERVLSVRNDLGLLAEEYDPVLGRQLGNFPQAFSHVGIINTAHNLSLDPLPGERQSMAVRLGRRLNPEEKR